MQHGLLQRSFIPDRAQSELRDLSRYRLRLLQERTRFANRLQKVLEGTNGTSRVPPRGIPRGAMLAIRCIACIAAIEGQSLYSDYR